MSAGPAWFGPRLEFRAGILSGIREHRGHVGNGRKKKPRSRRMAVRNVKERDEKWTARRDARGTIGIIVPPPLPAAVSRNNFRVTPRKCL